MTKTALFGFLLLAFAYMSFAQQSQKTAKFDGVFAYAINSRQLVTIGKVNESNARLLTRAICPTHATSSAISLAAVQNIGIAGVQYDADREVPDGNYCLLVNSTAHPELFTWGSGDS